MTKKFIFLLVIALALIGIVILFQSGNWGTVTAWKLSSEGQWLLPLVAIAALLDSINPCAFSILILTIAFLFTLGKVRSSVLKIGGVYILGIFVTYMMIGLGLLKTLHLFNTPHFMAKIGAGLLIALGVIHLLNVFLPAFPIKPRLPRSLHVKMAELMEKGSIPAAFVLGGLVGLCEFPCTGGPYLMVIGLLKDQATWLKGLNYLVLYNAIFILPLIILLLITSEKALLEKVQAWKTQNIKRMKFWSGLLMILLGLLIFNL